MPARTLPNLGLQGFFDVGEDGWDDEMSLNLLKLSVLTQAGAISKVSATPGAPANGDIYIFDETHPTQANKVAIRDDGAWVYATPVEGWLIYNRAENYYEKFDGAVWAELSMGAGASLPPGGDEGQVLGKLSADDGDVDWIDMAGGSGGGGSSFLVAGHFTNMHGGAPTTSFSKNIASIVRTAAGLYTINFINPLPNLHCIPMLEARWDQASGSNAACFVGINRNTDIAPGGMSLMAINLRFAIDGAASLDDPDEFWIGIVDPSDNALPSGNSGGGLVKIGEYIVTGAAQNNLTVDSIPASYRDLLVVLDGKGAGGGGASDLSYRVNGDAGNNYHWVNRNKFADESGAGTSSARAGSIGGGTAASGGMVELTFSSYSRTDFRKAVRYQATGNFGEGSGDIFYSMGSGYWRNTAAINSITMIGSENFAVGTVMTVYGRGENTNAPVSATPTVFPVKVVPDFPTWVNQGGAAKTINADGTVTLSGAMDATDNVRGVFRPLPAAPWRYRIGLIPHFSGVNFQNCGVALRDSATGKMVVFCVYLDATGGGSGPLFFLAKYDSPTVKNANIAIPYRERGNGPHYIDIQDDGVNRKVSFGYDQYIQRLVGHSTANNTFIVPDQIGLITNNTNTTTPLDMTVFSWDDLS